MNLIDLMFPFDLLCVLIKRFRVLGFSSTLPYGSNFLLYLSKWRGLVVLCMWIQHFGLSPLPTYEPAFDWQNERSMIYGQRIPDSHISQHGRLSSSIEDFHHPFIFHISVFNLICQYFVLSLIHILFLWFFSGLKISVKVLSLSFQAGLVGMCQTAVWLYV